MVVLSSLSVIYSWRVRTDNNKPELSTLGQNPSHMKRISLLTGLLSNTGPARTIQTKGSGEREQAKKKLSLWWLDVLTLCISVYLQKSSVFLTRQDNYIQ